MRHRALAETHLGRQADATSGTPLRSAFLECRWTRRPGREQTYQSSAESGRPMFASPGFPGAAMQSLISDRELPIRAARTAAVRA